ncbi:MAG: putative 2OG-Fe(II) oxygenase [Erythrobacter sp.]|nr:putative 2OG-Fe(II) oxygenase [Erythrobacter sp.]
MIGLSAEDWYQRASTASQSGDLVGALGSIGEGLKAHPKSALLWHAGGSLLLMQGRPDEAAEHFGKAFVLEPKQFDHAVDQAIALSNAQRDEEALKVLVRIEKKGAKFAHYCSTRGNAERGAGNHGKAAKWYDRALKIEPERPKALLGRANVALERGEPKAVQWFDRTLKVDPGNPLVWLGKAQALDVAGDREGALTIMRQITQQAPSFTDGLRYLAQLRHAQGEKEFASHYADAVKAMPQDPNIPDGWCKALAALELNEQALDVAAEARRTSQPAAYFALLEAVYAGASGDHERAEAIFADLDWESTDRSLHEARHRIRRKEFDKAEALLDAVLASEPADIAAWSLRDMLWRLTEDARADWLHGQEGLIQLRPIAGRQRMIEDAIAVLRELHESSPMPLGQSLRGGSQTRGVLFDRAEPVLAELDRAIAKTLEEYRNDLPALDPGHPLLRHRQTPWRLAGSWSVRLTGGGDFHAAHIHPSGIVSSAFYLIVPPEAHDGDRRGWLELGRPPTDLGLDLPPIRSIEPQEGHLALFPSTLYHGTTPFGSAERMTVAFDVVPKR